MTDVLIFVLGGLAGALVTWLALRAAIAAERAIRDAGERAAAEKLRAYSEAEERLSDAFRALSAEALRINNEQFLQTMRGFQENAREELARRQNAIGELVSPLRESLDKVDSKLQQLEVARTGAYSTLTEQVRSLAESQNLLRSETANLVKALRSPAARGRWGEIQLKRVVEMAGMLEYCDFIEQHTLQTPDGRIRPDLTVRLPNNRRIVVDSKVPLAAYLESIETQDDQVRAARLKDHAAQLRAHISRLATKSYWSQFEAAPDFVVAFLPGEAFFAAALQAEPALIEYGIENRVLIATPTTLIALLKAVAYGWRQESVAQNAQEISRLGRDLYERIGTLAAHFAKVGSCLDRATEAYNQAVGTLESRVLVSARKLREKGVGASDELGQPEPLERIARPVTAPELGPQAGGNTSN